MDQSLLVGQRKKGGSVESTSEKVRKLPLKKAEKVGGKT